LYEQPFDEILISVCNHGTLIVKSSYGAKLLKFGSKIKEKSIWSNNIILILTAKCQIMSTLRLTSQTPKRLVVDGYIYQFH